MGKVICIRHPHYDPQKAPTLSCKMCCENFIRHIQENAVWEPKREPEETIRIKKLQKERS